MEASLSESALIYDPVPVVAAPAFHSEQRVRRERPEGSKTRAGRHTGAAAAAAAAAAGGKVNA